MELLASQVDELLGSLQGATKAAAEQQWLMRLEHLKEELLVRHASKLQPKQRWRAAVGYCALVGAVVAQWPESWQRSPDFLLDDAMASALSSTDADSASDISSSRASSLETPALRTVAQLLAKSQDCAVTLKAVIRFGVVVAANQLIQLQKPAHTEALLGSMVSFCDQRPQLRSRAKWARFLLAMVHWTHHQDVEQALRCFRQALSDQQEVNGNEDADDDEEEAGHGVFLYWYALALYQNGSRHEALAALNKCLRYEYEPISSLTLSAWSHLEGKDLHEAANALQRAMEIDFAQSTSMFNHSLLLGRLNQFEAQQQMLQYYVQATTLAEQDEQGTVAANKKRKRPSGSKEVLTLKPGVARSLFSGSDLAALFPVKRYDVSADMVHLQSALAAMENCEWRSAKREFEALFAAQHTPSNEATRDYVYVLLQCDLPSLAMDSCDQLLAQANVPDEIQVYAHMYKADALLCLERVAECQAYLKSTVEPTMDVLLKTRKVKDRSSKLGEELSQIYVELLNNLAVVTACCDGADAAVVILRRGIQRCPSSLFLKFNLVLLMWRCDQKPSACAIWMETRGWNLDVDCETLADDQQALAFVAAKEEAALRSSSSGGESVLSRHVCAGKLEQGVSYQQLLFLDALVVNYWGKIRNLQAIQSSVNYVNYLGSMASNDRPDPIR